MTLKTMAAKLDTDSILKKAKEAIIHFKHLQIEADQAEQSVMDLLLDLPWDHAGAKIAIEYILDSWHDVLADFKRHYGYDVERQLTKHLKELNSITGG